MDLYIRPRCVQKWCNTIGITPLLHTTWSWATSAASSCNFFYTSCFVRLCTNDCTLLYTTTYYYILLMFCTNVQKMMRRTNYTKMQLKWRATTLCAKVVEYHSPLYLSRSTRQTKCMSALHVNGLVNFIVLFGNWQKALSLSLTHTHKHTHSLSLSRTHSLSFQKGWQLAESSLSLSLSLAHTHTLSLSLSHTHAHTLSLSEKVYSNILQYTTIYYNILLHLYSLGLSCHSRPHDFLSGRYFQGWDQRVYTYIHVYRNEFNLM